MKLLERVHLAVLWFATLPGLLCTWKTPRNSSREVRVNYGHKSIPSAREEVFGGLVKLQDLHSTFPNSLNSPTLLYLVSSALPFFPVRLAKMAKRAGAKLIINQNGVAYPGWYGPGWERANTSMQELLWLADYVVYQSSFCKKSADKFLGQRQGLPHEILYNPVDTSFFRPADEKVTRIPESITLLLAGSHWSPYRVLTALDTVQLVREHDDRVLLQIAGRFCWHENETRAREEVFAHAKQLGIADSVQYSGTYTQQQAPDLMRNCSILLHTKYNDPCPRLVVEAMACGLPVVYSATGGVPELVGLEAGVGVPGPLDWEQDHPPEAKDLAGAVHTVLAGFEQYARSARTRAVEHFDVKAWLNRHEEIFKELLG